MSLLDAMRGAPNLSQPLHWLTTAGQPSAEQLAAAREAGAEVVIDLRDPMEARPFDEPTTVRSLGMTYYNIPVASGALDDQTLGTILERLRAHAGTPTILHCASANRVGGALLPYLILDEKMSEEDATQAAMKVGLRSAELLEWGRGYSRR